MPNDRIKQEQPCCVHYDTQGITSQGLNNVEAIAVQEPRRTQQPNIRDQQACQLLYQAPKVIDVLEYTVSHTPVATNKWWATFS